MVQQVHKFIGVFCLILISIFIPYSLLSQNSEMKLVKKIYNIEIVNIDSTNDYIIIYAQSNEKKFKIVTRKVTNDCKNVFISGHYSVTLTSLNDHLPPIMKNSNLCDSDYGWPGNNIITNEADWDCDIFLVDEIFGLCYTTDTYEINNFREWIQQHPIKWIQQHSIKTE